MQIQALRKLLQKENWHSCCHFWINQCIRIKTLGALREQNIDFDNMLLKLQAEIMKSHRPLILPLDDEMCTLLRELISINDDVRKEYREKNEYICTCLKRKHTEKLRIRPIFVEDGMEGKVFKSNSLMNHGNKEI